MMCKCTDCANDGFEKALKGLVIGTGFSPVAKHLAGVAVGPLLALTAMVGGVWGGFGYLLLEGTVLCFVEIEAVANVAELPRRKFLLFRLLVIVIIQFTWTIPIESSSSHFLQFVFEFPIFPLEVNDD